jgi:hypothetical protein
VYNADGTVDVYRPNGDGGHEHVVTAPPDQPSAATISNYEDIPW